MMLTLIFIVIIYHLIVNDVGAVLKVSVIKLSPDAYISRKFNFSLGNTSFCAFIQTPPFYIGAGSRAVFTLRDTKNNSTLRVLNLWRAKFILEENGNLIDENKFSYKENFTKLCVLSPQVTGADKAMLMINNDERYSRLLKGKLIYSNTTAEETEIKFTVRGLRTSYSPAPSTLTIAGLFITNGMTKSFEEYFDYDFYKEDSAKLQNGLTYTDFNEWSDKWNSTIANLPFFNILVTRDKIIPLHGKTYKDPNIACKQLNGRPIGRDEIIYHGHFLHQLINEKTQVADEENNTMIWIERCQFFDVKSKKIKIACAPPNYPWTLCIYNEMELFSFRWAGHDIGDAPGTLLSHVFFDRYSLTCDERLPRNNSLQYLKFRSDHNTESQITFSDDKWRVNISSTSDVWFLNETKLPLGKNTWQLENEDMKQDLLFSTCHWSQHVCNNGQCIFPRFIIECNGEEDCADGSDELHCPSGTKIYRHHQLEKGITQLFEIDHYVQISTIGEMKFSDRSLKVNLDMTLSWLDKRFLFRKGIGSTTYNCSYLPWNPNPQIFSCCDNEISVDSTIGKRICFTKFEENEVHENEGHYSHACSVLDSIVHQKIQIQFELPCRFEFELFPFASQTCNFSIGIQNVEDYKFIPLTTPKINYSSSSISNLGDFTLESLTHVVINNTKLICFSIDLSSPFNYYIVAGYLPSVLILLVSYITLFFRLDLFSERIGVSLTALLTMVFLFVETNSNVIKTSYIKYLDIWFLSTMTFSVGLVLFNSLLHYNFWKREEVEDLKKMKNIRDKGGIQETSSPEGETELKVDVIKGPDSSQRKINRRGRIVFPILFLIFCLGYLVGASN